MNTTNQFNLLVVCTISLRFLAFRIHVQQGYSQDMLTKLNVTSKYSAEHQLYNIMYELLAQNSIVAEDFKARMFEIMTGMETYFKGELNCIQNLI